MKAIVYSSKQHVTSESISGL